MGLVYNVKDRRYDVSYEKTDFNTNYRTNFDTSKTIYVIWNKGGGITYFSAQRPNQGNYRDAGGWTNINTGVSNGTDENRRDLADAFANFINSQGAKNAQNYTGAIRSQIGTNDNNRSRNNNNAALNQANRTKNQTNQRFNKSYNTVLKVSQGTLGGDYVEQRKLIREITGVPKSTVDQLQKDFKRFYQTEKLVPWDNKQGALDPLGKFDPKYYRGENSNINAQWAAATADDNIDITERYGTADNLAWWDYTTTGKGNGKRGSAAEATKQANEYTEKALTDKELNDIRKKQLGIGVDTEDRFVAQPDVAAAWDAARDGTNKGEGAYWRDLAEKNFLDPNDKKQFMMLFRRSERKQDQDILKKINESGDFTISDLEDLYGEVESDKLQNIAGKYGGLTVDVLNKTINEMKIARDKEAKESLYGGLGAVGEIRNMSQEVANSVLGDSGLGGVLSFGQNKYAEMFNPDKLATSISKLAGVGNNATYNWQKFFDDKLQKEYQDGVEVDDPTKVGDKVQVDAAFAKTYIDKYIKPRFDYSRSMDEFEDYIGQDNSNPIKTEDFQNSLKTIATTEAEKYIAQVQGEADRYFQTDFYFNPTGNTAKDKQFADQKARVSSDWDAARADGDQLITGRTLAEGGLGTWNQQAYRFGADLTNKDQFAKMHYELIGQGQGYDPTDDIINASKVNTKLKEIKTSLEAEKFDLSGNLDSFSPPEEYADAALAALDPLGDEEYKEALKGMGLEGFFGTSKELKNAILGKLTGREGITMRRNIRYLQENKIKPTQDNLGITYIARDEDDTKIGGFKEDSRTKLYDAFRKSGYTGSENEFYEKFMPDASDEDQELLYQAASGKDLMKKFDYRRYTDPSSALDSIGDFMASDDGPDEERFRFNVTPTAKKRSAFRVTGSDEDYEFETPKTASPESILGEFTDAFRRRMPSNQSLFDQLF